MTEQMRAARLHERQKPMTVDLIDKPTVRPSDVLIEVRACGVVPNMTNVIHTPPPVGLHLLDLPAVYGLDVAGVIVEKGSLVHGFEVGDRVYVNPARYCTNCAQCRKGHVMACEHMALNGYLGSGAKSPESMGDYPHGGFAEYMTAPPYSLVRLPDSLSFETAARWGYLGTGYAALRRANVDMTTSVLINGISGTLGVGIALFALALGAPRILGVGRNVERLEKIKALAPDRIHVHSTVDSDQSIADWARSVTDGAGADVVIDALSTGSPAKAFLAAAAALSRGGTHVNVGGVIEEVALSPLAVMNFDQTYVGNMWFTPEQGQEMADLAASGLVNLDLFEHAKFSLEGVNDAIATIEERNGGWSNFVVTPWES
ncbi:alcohol dehydrogenase catalytic domain-containing protein [Nocardioides sp. NPDC006303]|uniref:alcohol dehydrogenase catalytic domain-containing protein n=1 Tax=Nocardioides sp. NPDC006303 TaxID=3156747 RepID=UPI0033AC2682